MYYNLALGVLRRFLRVFAASSVSAVCLYWAAHLGDVLPVWAMGLFGAAITGGLAALDKWVRAKLAAGNE